MANRSRYQKVVIIGAGPAGLTAIKCLLEEGLNPIAFERGSEIGGNWRYDESQSGGGGLAYRSLKTNSSRRMTAYSDYPFPSHLPEFLSRAEVLQYLNAYADHFHLRPYIHLQTTVDSATQAGGQWQIVVRTPDGNRETHTFDALIVASGFYCQPFTPSFPGAETFQGQVLHSADYKGPEGFEGKRVVVIGSGSSGADIAAEVSEVAAQVEISSRSGAYFVPYMVNGRPYDTQFNRFGQLIPPKVSKPLFHKMLLSIYAKIGFTDEKLALLRLPEFDPVRARFVPTVNLLEKILNGVVTIKPDIVRIEPHSVIYTDQTQSQADVLIYGTGYSLSFPFLPPTLVPIEGRNRIGLYKQVFHRDMDNLVFLAMNFVAGAALPLAEMQSRWIAQVFAGKLELPPPSIRAQAIDQYFANCERLRLNPMQLQLADYMKDIANILAVQPRIIKHLDLIKPLWFGPLVPAQYRLDGPGKSERATEIIAGA